MYHTGFGSPVWPARRGRSSRDRPPTPPDDLPHDQLPGLRTLCEARGSGRIDAMPRLPEREPVPADVAITSVARTPVWDSTVGVAIAEVPARGTPRNRLV